MNQSQDKHKMTGMYPTLNFTLVKYSSNPEQLPSCSMVSFTVVYAIWIKDGYEQLGQESCKTRESEPGQVLNDRHIPRLEPCEIQDKDLHLSDIFWR
ncbi:hypothetical protein RRG08_022937 [Elysia crispata]|uniref:Uncharacterized protein n=1 Tax=Elysia crispata TaxID=231223 RepID=A0AAE0XN65_9GAST|nr:hypothetical protein RRG08_022937 [Elysia crispata]